MPAHVELGQPKPETCKVRMDSWYLAEIVKIPFIASLLHCRPAFVRKHISNSIEVELSVLLAFHGLVAFSLAVLADIRGSLGAINSRVTFLLADTAGTLEHTGLRAFGLGVAVFEVN